MQLNQQEQEPDWSLTPKQRERAAAPKASSAPQVKTAPQAWLDSISNPSHTLWRCWTRWQRTFLQQASDYTPDVLKERLTELETLEQECQASLRRILAEEKTTGKPQGPAWEKVNEKRLKHLGQAGAIREVLTWWEKRLPQELIASRGSEPLLLGEIADPFASE